jgi:hypothetical protein
MTGRIVLSGCTRQRCRKIRQRVAVCVSDSVGPQFRWTPALQPSAEAAAHAAGDQRDQEQHERDEEHDLGDTHGRAGDTTKSENGRDQSDNQKRDDEAQHRSAPRCSFEL